MELFNKLISRNKWYIQNLLYLQLVMWLVFSFVHWELCCMSLQFKWCTSVNMILVPLLSKHGFVMHLYSTCLLTFFVFVFLFFHLLSFPFTTFYHFLYFLWSCPPLSLPSIFFSSHGNTKWSHISYERILSKSNGGPISRDWMNIAKKPSQLSMACHK